MDELNSDSGAQNNIANNVSRATNGMPNQTKDINLSTVSKGPNTANSVAIQTGQSSDASTQTVNDAHVKTSKSSKSSCIIA